MLVLVRIGEVGAGLAADLVRALADRTGWRVVLHRCALDPAAAHEASRGQWDSRLLLGLLAAHVEDPAARVIGLADIDLFASVFTFVFGEAHLGGRCAIISAHRLRPEVYGLPPDASHLRRRLLVELLHEWGHLGGAIHCRTAGCTMNFSISAEEIDLKGPEFCPACASTLGRPDQGAWQSVHGTSRQASPMSSG